MKASLLIAGALLAGCFVVAGPYGLSAGVAIDVAAPVLSPVPGTEIQFVAGVPGDVLFYDGFYWRWQNDMWWRSPSWQTGWVTVHTVPTVFMRIPPSHPAYHIVPHHPQYRPPVRPGARPSGSGAVRPKEERRQ